MPGPPPAPGCRPGRSLCFPGPAGSAACAVETVRGPRVKRFIFWQTEKSALNLLNLIYLKRYHFHLYSS